MEYEHIPVLLQEALALLNIQKGGTYIDATLGGGGHFEAVVDTLEALGGGTVIGIDQDQTAIDVVQEKIAKKSLKTVEAKIIKGNFVDIGKVVSSFKIQNVNGVLYDLGISSHQIDKAERGFSYQVQGPLDMRMDQNLSVTAKDLINGLYERELETIFLEYGEERYAKRIARGIVHERKASPILTTLDLVKVIKKNVPLDYDGGRTPKPRRVFQALRIAVNTELESITLSLPQAFDLLALRGTLVVISFHSLEDRIVKHFFKAKEKEGKAQLQTKKIVKPLEEEVQRNIRAKSAKLRSLIKI